MEYLNSSFVRETSMLVRYSLISTIPLYNIFEKLRWSHLRLSIVIIWKCYMLIQYLNSSFVRETSMLVRHSLISAIPLYNIFEKLRWSDSRLSIVIIWKCYMLAWWDTCRHKWVLLYVSLRMFSGAFHSMQSENFSRIFVGPGQRRLNAQSLMQLSYLFWKLYYLFRIICMLYSQCVIAYSWLFSGWTNTYTAVKYYQDTWTSPRKCHLTETGTWGRGWVMYM